MVWLCRAKKVLLIDLDPQGQSAISLGIRAEPGASTCSPLRLAGVITVQQWLRKAREHLWMIPGDISTQCLPGADQRRRPPAFLHRWPASPVGSRTVWTWIMSSSTPPRAWAYPGTGHLGIRPGAGPGAAPSSCPPMELARFPR